MSVPAEAARRDDCLEFSEIEVADRLQCLGEGAIVQVLGQRFEPGGILRLQRDQLGDSVAPAFGTAAVIQEATCSDCRYSSSSSGTAACLSLGISHGSFTDRVAWQGPLRSVTSRNPGHGQRSGAVLEAPALVAGLNDVAVVGETVEQGGSHLGVA